MVFDEIIVGSGLAALGCVLGMSSRRRVLVLAGESGAAQFYDATNSVPCARPAFGGLGEYWHGVIPAAGRGSIPAAGVPALARYFYPGTDFEARAGKPWLFVPRHPVRPRRHWPRLLAERPGTLRLEQQALQRFELSNDRVVAITAAARYEAARIWICAGALHTPTLLERSLGVGLARPMLSDHVICYLGLLRADARQDFRPVSVERGADGAWFECRYGDGGRSLCTLRPARFGFRRLDYGLEQRAAFGLPMGGALAKIFRRASPGLISEALYNKLGWFPRSPVYSVYAQVEVPDAYSLGEGAFPLTPRPQAMGAAMAAARAQPAWAGIEPSKIPERYLPGIHLHGSVDADVLQTRVGAPASASVQVVDASIYRGIGPEHHSFKVMAAAAALARDLTT